MDFPHPGKLYQQLVRRAQSLFLPAFQRRCNWKPGGGYHQTSLSPKFGIVYQPVKDQISVFGNYQNSFRNQEGSDAEGKIFRPEQANQLEAGVKLDLSHKLSATFSWYSIRVKDILRPDAANPNFSIQDGTQQSTGLEAQVTANPLNGLNILAGFSYNDSKLEKADADVQGRRPETASSPNTANLWLSYRFTENKLKGLGIGLGGNYASDNKVVNSARRGVFILPAYSVWNASIFYEAVRFRIGIKLDNLTNEHYWIGYTTVNPQQLRSFAGTIAFKF